MQKILNLFPKASFPNFGIGSVSLILSIPLMFAYLPLGWHAVGAVLFLISVCAWIRFYEQKKAGL